VTSWRELPNPANWGVTPATQRLLQHWRTYQFHGPKPFFCQVEAVETAIWLAEVARRDRRYERFRATIQSANEQANPDLFRIALKWRPAAARPPSWPCSSPGRR